MFCLSQGSRNRKSAKSVIRMVFKPLETFLNRFNFLTLMRCKVKLLEILLRSLHTNFWLSKTQQLLSLTSQPSVKTTNGCLYTRLGPGDNLKYLLPQFAWFPLTLLSQLHVWTGRWIQHVQKCGLYISNSLLSLEAEWLESAIFYCYFFALYLIQCSFPRGLKVTYCTLLRRVKIFPSSTDQPRKDNETIMKKLSYPWSRVTRFLSRRVLKRGRGMILTN